MASKIISIMAIALILLSGMCGCRADAEESSQTQPGATVTQPITPTTTQSGHTTTLLPTTQPGRPPVTTSDAGDKIMKLAMSDKPRVTNVSPAAEDVNTLTRDLIAFTVDLYANLSANDGNLFLSPYSIYQALTMTLAGARNETETQMVSTLRLSMKQKQLYSAVNSLDLQLAQRGETNDDEDGDSFRLNIVNAIWGQDGYYFLPEFLDTLAQYYGAGVRLLDFSTEPEPSRIFINDWVSQQTDGRIEDLLSEGSILEHTRLVLTNAIYFNASWKYPFDEILTKDGLFYLPNGSLTMIPMMNQANCLGYAKGANYQVVELPYYGGDLSMVILLPEEGMFTDFESDLGNEKLSAILGDIEYQDIMLSMPKFEFDSEFSLKQTLAEMGMPVAFSDLADFSGMNGNHDLCIGDVVHKSFIAVDEAGTEAAAATAVSMIVKATPEETIEVAVNRPFIFMIRDIETGTILFMGRVLNPAVS